MLAHTHYIPVMKSKKGEFDSLKELTQSHKGKITPLIEVVPPTADQEMKEKEKKKFDPEKYFKTKVIVPLEQKWGSDNIVFVCHSLFDYEEIMVEVIKGIRPVTYIFNGLRKASVKAIPVTTILAHKTYQSDVREILKLDNRGLCVRLRELDWTNGKLTERLQKLMNFFDLTEKDIDLIIDLKDIRSAELDKWVITVIKIINNILPSVVKWRSLTLTASSFPINLSVITKHSEKEIPRIEWNIWKKLLSEKKGLKRMPSYGDYTILHPDLPVIDSKKMNRSAQIRYTSEVQWLIIKGEGVKQGGSKQSHNLCRILTKRDEYCGKAFSWGDGYIHQCSRNEAGPGSPSTWRKVENSHHIIFAVNQLSNSGEK